MHDGPIQLRFAKSVGLRNASIYKLKKPLMIIATGHAAEGAKVPAVAKIKKPLDEILTVIE